MENKLREVFKNNKILVTGGTGSIGSEIVRILLNYNPGVIRIFSNDEHATFQMRQELGDRADVRFLMGDIRDKERLKMALDEIAIIYHAAALKHVPLCEYNPVEAIKTNVLGTQNVIEAALEMGVEKVISISTDKAVNPINTMGATKLLSEKLTIDANFFKGTKKTIFSSVRFGNVAFSRGSVIPLLKEQIKIGGPVTITDPNMTRFMMTLSDTINLIFKATILAKGGEIFILKMPVVRIGDLVDIIIDEFADSYGHKRKDIQRVITGARPGEKMFEELMTEVEARTALETDEMFIVRPQVEIPSLKVPKVDYQNATAAQLKGYLSKDIKPISKEEIRRLLFE